MHDLFRRGSATQLKALTELRDVLRGLGFYAEKARATEDTLRVYPERRYEYPLLNPRFEAPTEKARDGHLRATLVIAVLSRAGVPGLATRLLSFRSTPACRFEHKPAVEAGLRRHGHFVLQVEVSGGVPKVPSEALVSIRECLTTPRRPA